MRNLLAFLGAVIVTVVGVGWYLDWFKVHRGTVGESKSSYNIELNTKKIDEDLHKGTAKVHDVVDRKLKGEKLANPTPPPSISRAEEESGYALPPIGGDRTTSGPILLPPPLPAPPR